MEANATPKGAKGGEEDPSMEDILQSIRKIIADDGDEGKDAGAAKAPADNAKMANGQKTSTMKDEVPGSDVLELTEMVAEDGSVTSLKADAKPAEAAKPADVLNKIDEALAADKKPAAPVATAAPVAPVVVPETVAVAPVAAPPAPKPAAPAPAMATPVSSDGLLSSEASNAAAAALKKLNEPPAPLVLTPSPQMASGNTVEAMVLAMLKPMVKEWLDTNLPIVVERIVEREVKKLTRP
jgi:cell pole-organizing protein PopZ